MLLCLVVVVLRSYVAAADVLPVVLHDFDFACQLDQFHDFTHAKEPKKAWNSDDEDVDEFGRKKKRGAVSLGGH